MASLQAVLKHQRMKLQLTDRELKSIKQHAQAFAASLMQSAKSLKINAEVFLGGSLAKNTLVKEDTYDIDLFIRFHPKHEDISALTQKIIEKSSLKRHSVERLHGSRDYFRIYMKEQGIIVEVIPVVNIQKTQQAQNVTDLSYFHVAYVKRAVKGLEHEVILAKQFCKANRVYGAESYIQGFSGYALEVLVIHYKGFQKMLKALVKAGEKTVIDSKKHFKSNPEVLISLNEGKLTGPLVVVDPTCKERNVTASLSHETFAKFLKTARAFLARPHESFFVQKEFSVEQFKKEAAKKKAQFVHVTLSTQRQAGDIAGTKMKKFSRFMVETLQKLFKVQLYEFEYGGGQTAQAYLVVQPLKKILRKGPAVSMKQYAETFRKAHKDAFVQKGTLYAPVHFNSDVITHIKELATNTALLKQMSISRLSVE